MKSALVTIHFCENFLKSQSQNCKRNEEHLWKESPKVQLCINFQIWTLHFIQKGPNLCALMCRQIFRRFDILTAFYFVYFLCLKVTTCVCEARWIYSPVFNVRKALLFYFLSEAAKGRQDSGGLKLLSCW